MQVRNSTAAYVPIVTGRVPLRFATGELYDFVLWVEDDDYWRAQIEQIHVVSPKRIELVPRVGSGVIVLGSLENYPLKLRKLKKLYQDGFSSFGWNDYAEVDLRFRGQVVCRK
jgi:cell division protein FtsQ